MPCSWDLHCTITALFFFLGGIFELIGDYDAKQQFEHDNGATAKALQALDTNAIIATFLHRIDSSTAWYETTGLMCHCIAWTFLAMVMVRLAWKLSEGGRVYIGTCVTLAVLAVAAAFTETIALLLYMGMMKAISYSVLQYNLDFWLNKDVVVYSATAAASTPTSTSTTSPSDNDEEEEDGMDLYDEDDDEMDETAENGDSHESAIEVDSFDEVDDEIVETTDDANTEAATDDSMDIVEENDDTAVAEVDNDDNDLLMEDDELLLDDDNDADDDMEDDSGRRHLDEDGEDAPHSDGLGWKTLEILRKTLRGLLSWMTSMEFLFLAIICITTFIGVRRSNKLSKAWANAGLVLSILSLTEFVADMIGFRHHIEWMETAIVVGSVNRMILLPLWLMWLGALIHKETPVVEAENKHEQPNLAVAGNGSLA